MQHLQFVWIEGQDTFKAILNDKREIGHHDVTVTDHCGNECKVEALNQYDHDLFIKISQETPLDFNNNYSVTIQGNTKYAFFTRKVLNSSFYYDGDDLGPTILENGNFKLKIWSPPATGVNCLFYDKKVTDKLIASKQPMNRRDQGIWELELSPKDLGIKNFQGYYYQLEVTCFGKTRLALDPYAKSLHAFDNRKDQIGKAAIIDLNKTNPKNFNKERLFNKDIMSNDCDFIGYEMHIRDFTIDPQLPIEEKLRGTFLGAAKQIPHLKDLGITHVQLLPVQSCYTVKEDDRAYQDESIPTDEINYNWGYDPHHYFAPNGWFSSNAHNPLLRVTELKILIQKLHKNSIGAIIDVVYNHIFNDQSLENIAPGCYLRRNAQGYISGTTGAGSSVGTRIKMVRKLICDSLKYFQEEFHINGFRFDLMGFLDQTTIKEIRESLGDDAILYGEGWEFTDLPVVEAITKTNLPPVEYKVGVFNDSCRDSYSGREGTSGFVQGNYHEGPRVRTGIIGAIQNYPTDYVGDGILDLFIDEYHYHLFAPAPSNTINFLSIHDGYTLWDKINLSIGGEQVIKEKLVKLSMAMLLTSQGRIVIHGGDEIARTKPLASNDPTQHRAHTSPNVIPYNNVTYFHENSYRSPDVTNKFDWDRKKHFINLYQYVAGLIELRREFNCFHYAKASSIKEGIRFVHENIPNSEKYDTRPDARYGSWDEVTGLYLEFINGPPNQKLYIIGEVHSSSASSKNPEENAFCVDFNKDGIGHFEFNQEEVKNFDFGAWSDPSSLLFKLVEKPGEWNCPDAFYSKLGCNTVRAKSILRKTNRATIDLSIVNHTAGEQSLKHNPYIAYFLDNSLENSSSKYGSFLVVHNADTKSVELKIPKLEDYKTQDILVDDRKSGIGPISHSPVKIFKKNRIIVPGKSCAVVGLA